MIPIPPAVLLAAALVMAGIVPADRAGPVQVVPPPPSAPAWSRCPEWWALAVEVGWPADEWPTLDRLLWCESRCEPAAYNRSGASGLLQIMPGWHRGRDPFDPATNLTMGREVFAAQGWRAWSCY